MNEIISKDEQFLLKKKKILWQLFMRPIVIFMLLLLSILYFNVYHGEWHYTCFMRLWDEDYLLKRYSHLKQLTVSYGFVALLSFSSMIKLYISRNFILKPLIIKIFILYLAFVIIVCLIIVGEYKSMWRFLSW